jgi:16S rRNA processing protein RimM
MELVVGRVAKAHGIKGEVIVEVRTDEPEQRFAVGTVLRGRKPRERSDVSFTVEAAREHTGRLLLRLRGVEDRTAAEALRGILFLVESDTLPPSDDPDEYYDHELEGLRAQLPDGTVLGVVREVLHTPGGELLALEVPVDAVAGDALPADAPPVTREVLVPFVMAMVPTISVAEGFLVVDPPEGLLEV